MIWWWADRGSQSRTERQSDSNALSAHEGLMWIITRLHDCLHCCMPTPSMDTIGGFVMNRQLLAMLFGCATLLLATGADAGSLFDGSWNITFVTQRGDCDPAYRYSVNIENGVITSPVVSTFKGTVSSSGAVRASVSVQDKKASGSGTLTRSLGRGTWTGSSGEQRCAGSWTAERAW